MCCRSQQLGKPLASKEEPSESDLASASAGSAHPEAHLPSICLKQVFPKYAKQFNYLRLVDRMANLFIRFLGIKGTMKLGPTGFRTFIRSVRPAPLAGWRPAPHLAGPVSLTAPGRICDARSRPHLGLDWPSSWHWAWHIVDSCLLNELMNVTDVTVFTTLCLWLENSSALP